MGDRDQDSIKLFGCHTDYKNYSEEILQTYDLPVLIYEYHKLELVDYKCLQQNVYIQKTYYASQCITKQLICTRNY